MLAMGASPDEMYLELSRVKILDEVCDAAPVPSAKVRGLFGQFGMNPGERLYRYLGKLFYRLVGHGDVTFRDLYEAWGVELCIVVRARSAHEARGGSRAPWKSSPAEFARAMRSACSGVGLRDTRPRPKSSDVPPNPASRLGLQYLAWLRRVPYLILLYLTLPCLA